MENTEMAICVMGSFGVAIGLFGLWLAIGKLKIIRSSRNGGNDGHKKLNDSDTKND